MNYLKEIVLKWRFVREALDEAERNGGIKAFPLAQKDVLETMRDDIDQQADLLADEKLLKMLSVVDPRKIVTLDRARGIVYIGGERAEEGRLANLKAEADFFTESELWHLIYETPKRIAEQTMFVSSESLVDLQKGKSMLFTLASQMKIIDTFKSYVPKK